MKLLRVKILGDRFRSLPANKDFEFNWTVSENKLSTKVFAGLNGSGKSNFLELLAEIFYYLELCHLPATTQAYKKNKNIGFEIEYILPQKNIETRHKSISVVDDTITGDIHVKIMKQLDELPEFSYAAAGSADFVRQDKNVEQLLPNKIIAYTSGQNELLSNPFIRLRYHYFKEMLKSGEGDSNHRLYFLDSESNYAIFIANMLLGPAVPLQYIRSIFKVEDLHAFRLTFNYKHTTQEAAQIFKSKRSLLTPLKACATCWKDDEKKKCLVLDFVVNQATHEAFTYYFGTAFRLFQTLYELQSLNLLVEKQEVRHFVTNASKNINITDELSRPEPSDWVFRIEKIRIKKKPAGEDTEGPVIYYKSFSDGEHQFNEIIGSVMMMEEEGSLFLMDEPDTHFNPKWRAKMVLMLNKVSGQAYDAEGNPENIRRHEVIMTTHSPFVISDNQKEDVYKFIRQGEEVVLENPRHETYGASITFLMKEIFERDITISDFAYKELEGFKEGLKSKIIGRKERIDEIKERLLDFGESVEKFDLYNYLSQLNSEE
ncbi:restriction system-associated AAA family ATPase [Larkinella rosea]|uniref:Restriction system-associated AAA family ATPase n=1 Tax=Larkinella rosea TaxID=2025312 RepID=A0A3P1BC71_9BACT|nr:restriction system-associated AAA family ATPase [Larkinella rosea]RRA98628.1 restriction system-associated AAA family ATPase [Larkinella rosea]